MSIRLPQFQITVAVEGPVIVVFMVLVRGLVVLTVVNQDEVPVVTYVVVPPNQISEVIVVVYVTGLSCRVSVQICDTVPHTVLVVPAGTITVVVVVEGVPEAVEVKNTVLV